MQRDQLLRLNRVRHELLEQAFRQTDLHQSTQAGGEVEPQT